MDEKRSARTDRTEVTALQERIGYQFRDPLLLEEALTHPSLGHETQRRHFDNQRLEFLGDAVLQLVITEYLYARFRSEAEGRLTQLRSRLVSRDALKKRAAAIERQRRRAGKPNGRFARTRAGGLH